MPPPPLQTVAAAPKVRRTGMYIESRPIQPRHFADSVGASPASISRPIAILNPPATRVNLD